MSTRRTRRKPWHSLQPDTLLLLLPARPGRTADTKSDFADQHCDDEEWRESSRKPWPPCPQQPPSSRPPRPPPRPPPSQQNSFEGAAARRGRAGAGRGGQAGGPHPPGPGGGGFPPPLSLSTSAPTGGARPAGERRPGAAPAAAGTWRPSSPRLSLSGTEDAGDSGRSPVGVGAGRHSPASDARHRGGAQSPSKLSRRCFVAARARTPRGSPNDGAAARRE